MGYCAKRSLNNSYRKRGKRLSVETIQADIPCAYQCSYGIYFAILIYWNLGITI